MSEYRVICDTHGTQEWETLSQALNSLQRARANPTCINPRMQRIAWEDVPEPEPLPDLPTEVWAFTEPRYDAPMVLGERPRWYGQRRIFRGTVSEWVEVTE